MSKTFITSFSLNSFRFGGSSGLLNIEDMEGFGFAVFAPGWSAPEGRAGFALDAVLALD
jgi:hypothetical protein